MSASKCVRCNKSVPAFAAGPGALCFSCTVKRELNPLPKCKHCTGTVGDHDLACSLQSKPAPAALDVEVIDLEVVPSASIDVDAKRVADLDPESRAMYHRVRKALGLPTIGRKDGDS